MTLLEAIHDQGGHASSTYSCQAPLCVQARKYEEAIRAMVVFGDFQAARKDSPWSVAELGYAQGLQQKAIAMARASLLREDEVTNDHQDAYPPVR